jgi:hypothetical protein
LCAAVCYTAVRCAAHTAPCTAAMHCAELLTCDHTPPVLAALLLVWHPAIVLLLLLLASKHAAAKILPHTHRCPLLFPCAASAGLGELLADLQEPLEASEHRITIKARDAFGAYTCVHVPHTYACYSVDRALLLLPPVLPAPTTQGSDAVATGTRVLVALKAWLDSGAAPANWSLAAENHEGWRINVDEGVGAAGWLLLRQSLHDPLLVLNLESDIAGGAAIMRGQVAQFLSSCDDAAALDLSSLA